MALNTCTLITNALLATNWEYSKKDYLDIITPFVLYSAFHECENEIGYIDIKVVKNFIITQFNLNIIDSIIDCILRRNTKYITTKRENGIKSYYLIKDSYDLNEFENQLASNERDYDYFLDKMDEYFNIHLGKKFERERLENKLTKFINGNFFGLLNKAGSLEYRDVELAKFLDYIIEHDKTLFAILQKIVKGQMIYVSIYSQDFSQADISQKLTNLYVYFDTTFIFYLLGYSGEYYKEYTRQIVDLLKGLGAKLRCFRHNCEEVRGILDSCVNKLRSGNSDIYNLDYFLDNNFSAADVALLRSSLEKNIKMFMEIVDTPDYSNPIKNIDWESFSAFLQKEISYKKDKTLNNDVESIAAIFRLRKTQKANTLENCNAIFVTTNLKLVRVVRAYKKEYDDMKGYWPCLSDYEIANLAWLKSPTKQGEVIDRSIRFATSTLQEPSPEFWKKFVKKIELYKSNGELGEGDAIELRYELYSRKNAQAYFEDDDEKITLATLQDFLAVVREQYNRETTRKLKQRDAQIEYLKKQDIREADLKAERKGRWYALLMGLGYVIGFVAIMAIMTASIIHLCYDWKNAIWAMVCIPLEGIGIIISFLPNLKNIWRIKRNVISFKTKQIDKIKSTLYKKIEDKYNIEDQIQSAED